MKIVLFESLIASDFARVILNWVGFLYVRHEINVLFTVDNS